MADHAESKAWNERIALRPREAAEALGISPRKLAELMADRSSGFPVVGLGRARLIPVRELIDYLTARIGGGQ